MLPGLRYAVIADPERHQKVMVMYPLPAPGNPWGVMEPLRKTSWGAQIPTVTGEALSHALHGRPKPLREMLGRAPQARGLALVAEDRMCLESQQGICAMAAPHCYPGSTEMPECYVCPTEDRTLRALGNAVARAWDEGRYVFIVEGPEFIVR